jgi:uncharacterized protein YqiB (DUF1249 family)
MLNDAVTLVSWRSRPRSFVALMSLYESNYVRLGWLGGALASLTGNHRSIVAGDCDLLLSVTERTPYTTTLNLTYRLDGASEGEGSDAPELRYPDMGIRVYHDAHLVEAQEWSAAGGRNGVRNNGVGAHSHGVLQALQRHAERELDQRWARNMMLNKWLEYCLERGHRFSPATLIPAY